MVRVTAQDRYNFPATRWSIVTSATGDDHGARTAMAWLCERYWEPLRAHACATGWQPTSADDLVQQLLCEIITRGDLAHVDPLKGRFRTWLKSCLDHLGQRERDKRHALKRGGGRIVAPLDTEPEAPALIDASSDFDRAWAREVITRALDRLADDEERRGAGTSFAALRPYLTCDANAKQYADVGVSLGLSEGAVKVAVHRLRRRYGETLRAELAETLAEPSSQSIANELAALRAALSSR